MLNRALLLAATFLALGPAFAGEPPKKDWEELRDHPIDYAPYERRRAENLKLGVKPLTQALAAGYAKPIETGSYPVIVDPAVTKGLSLELEKLLKQEKLQLKLPQIEFIVVDDLGLMSELQAAGKDNDTFKKISEKKEASNFFALSTGGGAIVVGLSVLRTVTSYDELDFVIGHEASHILYDHFTEDERKAKFAEYIRIGALIAGLATRRSDAHTKDSVGWSVLGLMVANSLLGPAWDRGQETEADALSYELMMELGRSQNGVKNVMERFQAQDDAIKEYTDALCGKKSAGLRFVERLVESTLGINIPDEGNDPSNPICRERNDLLASLMRDHPETKERVEDLDKHAKKYFPDQPKPPLFPIGNGKSTLLDFLSPDGEASRSVHAYDGLAAYHRGDIAAARQFLQQHPPRGDSEKLLPVLELSFYLANLDGRRDQALHFLDLAANSPEHSLRFSKMAEEEYANDARWADAARIVKRRIAFNIATPQEAYPLLISYLRLAGKSADVEKELANCKAIGDAGLTLACEATAHPPPGQEPLPPAARPQ